MSCPRIPEASAFLLEEGGPDYAAHLESCPDCQEALLEAAEVLDAVAHALARAGTPKLPASPEAPPLLGWQKHWPLALGAALLLVAVGLNVLRPMTSPRVEPPTLDSAMAALDLPDTLALEDELDLLDQDLAALSLELEEL